MKSLTLVKAEIERTRDLVARIEEENTRNDRIAVALAYLGRASDRVLRNQREGCDPVENLIKAAAVLCVAIEAEL